MVLFRPLKWPLMLAMTVGLSLAMLADPAALAQQAVPAQVNPGILTPSPSLPDTTQQQKQQQQYLPEKPEVEKQTFDIQPTKRSTAIGGNEKFTVKHINLEGVTLFKPGTFRYITAPYENRPVTLDELSDMADAITTYYREAGYLTSQAYVPPQEVHDGGDLTVKVIEGKVGEMSFQGNHYYRTSTVARNFQERPGQPLNIKTLEKDLQRTNRLYDYQVRASLSPGNDTGETNIRIESKEAQPWQIAPTFDNQGRPFIGYYRGGVNIYNNSLTGHADRAYVQYFVASGTQSALASYFVPVLKRGDEIGVNYAFTRVDVHLHAANPPDIDGIANSAGLVWVHPFDRDRVWVGDFGGNYRRVNNLFNGTSTQVDEIRTVHAALNFDKFDHLGRTFIRNQATEGLNVLGGNWPFFKWETFLTRLITLPNNNVFIIRGYGQYSPNDLPTAEAFQLGGAYSVRGYTEGLFIGDRGYSLTLEDRMPIPFLGRISPWLDDRLQMAAFFDIGQAWLDKENQRFLPGISNRAQNTLLMGTGVGLRYRLTQYLQGFVDLGFGLLNRHAEEPNAQPTARVHFGVRSELLPKKYISRSDTIHYIDSQGHVTQSAPGGTPPQQSSSVQPSDAAEKPVLKRAARIMPPPPPVSAQTQVMGSLVPPQAAPPIQIEFEDYSTDTEVNGNIVSSGGGSILDDDAPEPAPPPAEIPLPKSEPSAPSGYTGLNAILK